MIVFITLIDLDNKLYDAHTLDAFFFYHLTRLLRFIVLHFDFNLQIFFLFSRYIVKNGMIGLFLDDWELAKKLTVEFWDHKNKKVQKSEFNLF